MTETVFEHRDRMALFEHLQTVLAEAATHRREREDIVETPDGPELGWVVHEREQMLAVVNAERASRGLPPAGMDSVALAERQAAGHSDYAKKFALYCSEVAFGLTRKAY